MINVKTKKPQAANIVNPRHPESSLPTFMQLLKQADALRVEDGPLLTEWKTAPWIGDPKNEVLHFSWFDEMYMYRAIFTEEGMTTGTFDKTGRFCTSDQDGDPVTIRLFKTQPISPGTQIVPA